MFPAASTASPEGPSSRAAVAGPPLPVPPYGSPAPPSAATAAVPPDLLPEAELSNVAGPDTALVEAPSCSATVNLYFVPGASPLTVAEVAWGDDTVVISVPFSY